MDITERLRQHRSIRRFRDESVDADVLGGILGAATHSATSGNLQPYSVVVTRDPARRQALWSLHREQAMILEAPIVLTFCCDWRRVDAWTRSRGARGSFGNFRCFITGAIDAIIYAQSVALAAEDAGLGICYMGTTLGCSAGLIDLLGLPELVFPVTSMVVGHPAEDPAPRSRLPMGAAVHDERYADWACDSARIDAVYADRDEEGWKRYLENPAMAEAIRAAGVTNLAQVYAVMKYGEGEVTEATRRLVEGVERQGFR